jgi:DNA-binding MarR family transcriptional regulator
VASLYTRSLDRALKPRGLDQPQWRVLMILREHDAAPMGTIAELAVMQLPTVVKLIQRMTRAGLVAVAPRERDRRIVEVRLTAEGRGALAHVRRAASVVYRRALAGLPAGEVDRVLAALARTEANLLELSAPTDGASPRGGPAPSRRRRAPPRGA